MPIRNGAPLGAPCWIDLATSDVDRAQDFYGTVFGWTFESAGPEYGGYINAAKDGHPVAGLMANNPDLQAPDDWATYFHTADINATVCRGDSGGRQVCLDPMEVPAKGFMAHGHRSVGSVLWFVAAARAPRLRGDRRSRLPGVAPTDHARLPRRRRLLPRGLRMAHRADFRH